MHVDVYNAVALLWVLSCLEMLSIMLYFEFSIITLKHPHKNAFLSVSLFPHQIYNTCLTHILNWGGFWFLCSSFLWSSTHFPFLDSLLLNFLWCASQDLQCMNNFIIRQNRALCFFFPCVFPHLTSSFPLSFFLSFFRNFCTFRSLALSLFSLSALAVSIFFSTFS